MCSKSLQDMFYSRSHDVQEKTEKTQSDNMNGVTER